jgi:hypothetical protein
MSGVTGRMRRTNRQSYDAESLILRHGASCPARKRGRPVDGKYVAARDD